MNFGRCNTPDCDYPTRMSSDYCVLCEYVMEREQEVAELNHRIAAWQQRKAFLTTAQVFGLYGKDAA